MDRPRQASPPPPSARPVDPEILAHLRLTCLDLPEAYEEEAWAGTRWMVRKKNFAHVLIIEAGWPPAYARAAGSDGTVLTFRSPTPERFTRPPYFRPVWFPNIAGLFLDQSTDWSEVAGLLTESYRILAPRKLAALVD